MKKSHIIAIVVVAISIGAILSTVAESSTYADFKTASERETKEFHVVGKLQKNKPQEYNPSVNANLFSFYMVDNIGIERKVVYNGTKPQDFDKSEQIVVVGKMNGQNFEASGILMKCPSKYNNTDSNVPNS